MKKLKPRYIEELNRVILQTKKGATSNYVHKRGHIMNEKYEDKSKLITTFYT